MREKKGFTLVELSIVLVIIGLLIGGILAARSMISTAKIQGVVRQVSQYDVMMSNFQTRYNSLPGDSTVVCGTGYTGNYCTSGYKGDGDGVVSYFETQNVWEELSTVMGLKNSLGKAFQPWAACTVANSPMFNIDQNPAITACFPVTNMNLIGNAKNYYLYFTPLSSAFGNGAALDPLRAKDVAAIDLKVDDGLPSSGKLISYKGGYSTPTQCVISGIYNVSAAGYSCSMALELGFTGNSQ